MSMNMPVNFSRVSMVGIALFVVILSIQAQAQDDQQSCNKRSCKDSTDCSSGDVCFPDPMLSGNHSFRNASCQSLDSPCADLLSASACAPIRSFIYNSTQQCPSCCGQGLGYRLYSCSPRIRSLNPAVLYAANVSDFNSTCSTQSAYSGEDLIVSLATGWISNKTLCLTNINISAPNNRFIVAKVVTECKSAIGCDQESSFREPCAPNAVAGTAAVWRALGYDSRMGLLKNISWSLGAYPDSSSIPDQGGLGKSSRSSSGAAAIGASVAAALILALSLLASFIWIRRKKQRKEEAAERSKQERELLQEMRLDQSLPRQFTLSDLQTATNNFSSNCKLGEGGFGSVFKGTLSDGSVVAVKRMDVEIEGSSSGQTQFKAEVMSIGSVHHFNLVRLCGFCIHSTSCLLVYEFLPNGSLDRWIFDRHRSELALEWRLRCSIAVDVARGLTYLHEGCKEQVLHLDIKPQNILLDESFRARISDFGLCKLAERGKSYVVSALRGTPGYMAPEWLNSSVTDKTDVYSFGIVLLQLVSSKKALLQPAAVEAMINSGDDDDDLGGFVLGLGVFARNVYQSGRMKELIDPRLLDADDRSPISLELQQFLRIALWCIQEDPQRRPSMEKVLQMLEGSVEVPEFYS